MEELLAAGVSHRSKCDGNPPLSMAVCFALHAGRAQQAADMALLLLEKGANPLDTCVPTQMLTAPS
jgi:hypothetical protein